jgi:hypothetical protein
MLHGVQVIALVFGEVCAEAQLGEEHEVRAGSDGRSRELV